MTADEITRLRDTTGKILERMDTHEKECLRLHLQHENSIRETRLDLARVARNQRWIIIGLAVVVIMEMIGDGQLLEWLISHVDIGG